MDSRKLLQWLDGCIDKKISQVYLLGGDVLMYKDLNEIWGMLEQKSMSIQLFYRYNHLTIAGVFCYPSLYRYINMKGSVSRLNRPLPHNHSNKDIFLLSNS